jgi:hypothetical protein
MNKAGIAATNTDVIDSALDASTTVLENILGTSLQYRQMIDYFDYLPSRFSAYNPFRLRLSQRFIDGIPRVYNTLTAGIPLFSVSDLTTASQVDESLFIVDADKGIVQFLQGVNSGYGALAVIYEAGFEDLDSNDNVDERIPDWLTQAAISGAVFAHHQQSTSHSKKDVKDMSDPLYRFMYQQVSNYIMSVHSDVSPARSEEV